MTATLFLVATPIGHLGDISARALETLSQVAFIACEDTRHSRILLDHYGIRTPTVSLPAFAEGARAGRIIERILGGDACALMTDAGSPGISDPGELLVSEALEKDIPVVPVPGPTALIAALSASGLPTGRFHFLGFLPRKGPDRKAMLEEVRPLSATLVVYESARRLAPTLAELFELYGPRRACVARELTKHHETFERGTLETLAQRYGAEEAKGEVVLLIEGRTGSQRWDEAELKRALEEGLGRGEKLKTLSTDLARRAGWSGQDVYRLGLSLARPPSED